MNTGIVIAVKNIGKIIDILKIEDFLEANKDIHICFVNNGSTDDTLEVLKLCEIKFNQRLSVVSLKKNKKIETALKAGFRFLLNTMNLSSISFTNQLNFQKLIPITEIQGELLN
jgi:glycosyltransferase involved in cell wall biosynthesis